MDVACNRSEGRGRLHLDLLMLEHVPIRPYWSRTMSLSPTTDPDHLQPTNPDDVAEAMSHALLFERGRRRGHHADGVIAQVTADLLVRHMLARGYVIMKVGAALAHTLGRTCRPRADHDHRQSLRPPMLTARRAGSVNTTDDPFGNLAKSRHQAVGQTGGLVHVK